MFDIAWSELLLVAIVAILVVGPKELPGLLRTLGRMLGKLRATASEFRSHFDEAVKEAGGEELQREMRSFKQNNPLSQVRNSIEELGRDPLNSGSSNSANSTPAATNDDDDLGPPPPLPPREGSQTFGTASAPSAASSGQTSHNGPGAVSTAKETEASESGNDTRVNGAHRATG